MAFCKNCGAQLKPQDKFCEVCGTLVEEEKPVAPVSAASGYAPPFQPAGNVGAQKSPAGSKKSGLPVIILACALAVVLIGGIIGIVSLSGTISDLRAENEQLVADKNQLTGQLNAANNTITGLNNDLNAANSEISELTGDLNAATGTIDDLNSDLAEANSSLNAANATIADLSDENEELAADKSELAADLAEANSSILALNSIIDIMNYNYSEIIAFIEMRFGMVEEDATQFVTPYDEDVEALVDWLVTPFDSSNWAKAWDDFRWMYNWINNNIEYSYDSPLPVLPLDLLEGGDIWWFREFWQYPVETIYYGTGDCEDQSLLLASMIKNYGHGGTYAYCIAISNGETGHMAVALPVTDNRMVIFDPAGQYYSSDWTGDVAFWDVTTALQDWLDWWSVDMPGAEVIMFFDDEDYWEFEGNADFLDWYLG
ncbi:MAG: zinc-ribbon domain-containing protein [Dehalococcoidales bacterium]|nr:zinc-ribbon domain-containing protein [Dehalococcoidales bacterium]